MFLLLFIQSINQSISFNETKNRLKVSADTAAAGTHIPESGRTMAQLITSKNRKLHKK